MVRDANDKPAYFIYIIEDVTRRKQAESELILSRTEMAQLNKDLKAEIIERRKAEEENRQLNLFLEERVKDRTLQLEITNRELESFSYSVSHDLRAPLRSIDGFGQALLEDYGDTLDPVANGYLQKIRSSTRHMSNLIDDMLRLARVTRVEMQITRVDISLIANRILEDLQTTQPERLVKVVIPEKIMVKADQDLIEIVLDNLLRNAWKFTNKCPLASIEMGMTRIKEKEVYFVRDNGAGFDMAYVDKLFKSFERLHRVQEYEGTGIGLAIVKRIIQRHGGEVWAEGEVNKGATFYFSLP
jgi:light-regulated signal transduction histidine kinase (bacteriophytochrome)